MLATGVDQTSAYRNNPVSFDQSGTTTPSSSSPLSLTSDTVSLSGGGTKQRFISGTVEFSIQAHIEASFKTSSDNVAGGSKTSAYSYQADVAVSGKFDFRAEQAESIANAHAMAFEGDPFSPEATAKRITEFAMSFFPMFAEENPDMTYEEQIDAYQKMVNEAIGEGFSEAMSMLGALPDEVMQGIEKTKDLVTSELNAMFDHMRGEGKEEAKEAQASGVWKDFVEEFLSRDTEKVEG